MYQNKQLRFLLVAYKQNAAGGVAGKVVQMTGNIQLSDEFKRNFQFLHNIFKDFFSETYRLTKTYDGFISIC